VEINRELLFAVDLHATVLQISLHLHEFAQSQRYETVLQLQLIGALPVVQGYTIVAMALPDEAAPSLLSARGALLHHVETPGV
jgi:hypothetical protein